LMQAVFALQAVERRESNAKAAVQVADGFKELGFQLRVCWLPVCGCGSCGRRALD
jgi:hypothetical protein